MAHTHKGIIAGKLKGHIPAQTPRGSLMQYVSIPFDALGTNSPICNVAIAQACSAASIKINGKSPRSILTTRDHIVIDLLKSKKKLQ
jgi:hypothetical protein